ncbi:MAG TPA: glycosyltransferase family 39 protein [Stellaceae bacterium]|jgi:4-amino-4-deoxy-L-arabinose transferase-like glycosyltransferase
MAVGTDVKKPAAAEAERSLRIAVFVVFAITVVRFLWIASGATDLYPDEAQYWLWSLHPDWGYYSKPPVVAWLIAASTWIAGSDNELAVRMTAPLLHFGTALMVYAIAQRLYDARAAFWSAVVYATLPGVWVSAVIMSTDAPLLFCWSVTLYAFVRARESQGARWWWLVSIGCGLGLLSKYAMAYWMISALLYLAIYRGERRHLPRFAGAMALALLIYAPNFLWNAAHGFVSYHHTEANAALGGPLFHPENFLAFFGSQFGVFGPVLFGALIVCAALGRRMLAGPREAMLAFFALPTLAMMLVVSFLSRAEPNWSAPTYLSATVLVVAFLLARAPRVLLWGSVALHVAVAVMIAEAKPLTHLVGYDLPGKYDPLHRLKGWRTLGATVGRMLAENPGTHLMADDRELMAALVYYVSPHPLDALKWNGAGGIHDQFDLTAEPAKYIGDNFLLVSFRNNIDDIVSRFATTGPVERITIFLGPPTKQGQPPLTRVYQVRLLGGFKGYR